jgi:hypothetical protein
MLRKTSVAAAVLTSVTAGSVLFGGTALADVTNTGGPGGTGGAAENNCLNLAVQVPILNLFGSDPSNSAACTATGGAGGTGGTGASY